MEIKRGGVYYIDNPTFTGHEMAKDRPAVVVSCDAMNCTSSVVSVVYMTGSKPADTPYRVRISAARRPSLSGKTTGKARSAPSRAWWYMSTRRGGITP